MAFLKKYAWWQGASNLPSPIALVAVSCSRGFTLVELMLASTIGLIIIAGASAFMVSQVKVQRRLLAQEQINARVAVLQSYLEPIIGSIGYEWRVKNKLGSGWDDGAWGRGYCDSSSNICSNPLSQTAVYPLEICTTSSSTCNVPGSGSSDVLRAIVPLGTVIEAVTINSTRDAADTNCSSYANNLNVNGYTSSNWNVGDLVMVGKAGNVTVTSVKTALAADTTFPPVDRDWNDALNITCSDLKWSDGFFFRDSPADAMANATVFRVEQILIRLYNGVVEVARNRTASQAAAPRWFPVVSGVDDLQFRLEIASFSGSGDTSAAKICTCDSTKVFSWTSPSGSQELLSSANGCTGCNTSTRFNADDSQSRVNRVVGLFVGALVHADASVRQTASVWKGLFNRTATVVTDRKARRRVSLYMGLPNARP